MNLVIAAAQCHSTVGNVTNNVAHHRRFGILAAECGVQLLVFPELSLTGYDLAIARANALSADAASLDPLRELATQTQLTLVAGAPVFSDTGDLHIAALVFKPNGTVSVHTKQHVHTSELCVFSSGPGGAPFVVGDVRVALAICADSSHPQHAADAAAGGAEIYAVGAVVTHEDYPRKSTSLKSYAIAHNMAVLFANCSGTGGELVSAGRSAIWSEDGELVVASSGSDEALIVAVKRNGQWTGAVLPLPASPSSEP
jgi:predicted amidohydrolase